MGLCHNCSTMGSETVGAFTFGFVGRGEGLVECETCYGTGKVRDDVECPTCDGRGVVTCPECDGTGRIDDDDDEQDDD